MNDRPQAVSGTPLNRAHKGDRHVFQRGDLLCAAGSINRHAYLIRTGCVISTMAFEDGCEEIVGLHTPGTVVGAEALLGLVAPYSIRAVDTTNTQLLACVSEMVDQCEGAEAFRLAFIALHREVVRLSRLIHLDRLPAHIRLARYLLDIGSSLGTECDGACAFWLPITRRELARLLGLSPETLSRAFHALQSKKLIQTNSHEIRIVQLAELRKHSLN